MVSRENNVKRQILMVLRCLLVVDEMLQGQCPALEHNTGALLAP